MTKLKRVLAIVLSFVLVLTVIPAASKGMEAKAAETFAITSPTANQLVAAGHIDIKWKAATAGTVSNYDVFINGNKVTTTTSTSYEYYTTKVRTFDTYVKANYTDGTSATTETITFGVSKKGLGLAQDMGANISLRDMGVAWYYNWGENPSSGGQYVGVEYVPMVWKETNANNFKRRVESAKSKGYKYILTFNEPDLQGQCNMSVNDVYNVWQGIEDMEGIRISSPVTALWPQASPNWFQSFMTRVDQNGDYQPDFISIHCYPDNYGGSGMANWFLENVVDWTWETYGLPIWITEFSTTGGSITATGGNGTKEFWETVMPGLDEREYVERYAAFGFNSSTTGLWSYSTGALTPGGQVYAQLGNPSGFTPEEQDYKVTTERRSELLDNTKTINNVVCEDYVNANGVTATSDSEIGNNGLASLAIDDDVNTRWESEHGVDPASLIIDLGSVKNIKEVDILWENASASQYNIEVSTDGETWTTAAESITGSGGRCDKVTLNNQASARYVKIYGISRSTDYGYSIFDVAIYGTDDVKVDETTTPEPTTVPIVTTTPEVTTKNWFEGLGYNTYQGTREYINGLGNWSVWAAATHTINIAVDPNDSDHVITQVVENNGNIGKWAVSYNVSKCGLTPGETYTVLVDIKGSSTDYRPTVDGINYYNEDKQEDFVTVEIPCAADENGYINAMFGIGSVGKGVFIDISNVVVKDSKGNIVKALDVTKEEITPPVPTTGVLTDKQTTTVKPTITDKTTQVTKPKKAKIKKVYAKEKASKKVKLSIKKIKGVVGYQIAIYKTKNNAKKNKKALVKKIVRKRKLTITHKKLKNKKTLYVRVRAYKLNGKNKVWGIWSSIKRVKIKKAKKK